MAGMSNHLASPGIDGMSYETLLRISEMLGPAVRRNTNQDDLNAQLRIIKYTASRKRTAKEAFDEDHALQLSDLVASTAEKCCICLLNYEEDDELRVMNCRHGFHRVYSLTLNLTTRTV